MNLITNRFKENMMLSCYLDAAMSVYEIKA